MTNLKLCTLLLAGLSTGGCMATLTPDGTVTAQYIVPSPIVVLESHPPYRHHLPPPSPLLLPVARFEPIRPPLAPQRTHIAHAPVLKARTHTPGMAPHARTHAPSAAPNTRTHAPTATPNTHTHHAGHGKF